MTQDEIILAQQARIEQLKSSVQWALGNINCEPFEWACEEDSDAHRHAIEALATQDDISALRAHDAELLEKCAVTAWTHYADTCKSKGVNPHHFGEWIASDKIRILAIAVEKSGV